MKVKTMKLSDLKKPERNSRIHSEKQIKEFIRSVEAFGQIRPIVTDENLVIICGNGLYEALTAMGRTEADVLVMPDLSEKDKKKLMLADNKIFSLGIDDMTAFEEILAELGDDLEIPGFDTELLETITANSNDLDDIMSGYGIVSDDTKAEMQKTSERYEVQDEKNAEQAEEVIPVAQPITSTGEAPAPEKLTQKFIVCPKCGERIWI